MKNKILQYITSDNYSKKTIDELSCSLNVEPLEFKDFVKAINELEEEGIIYITNKGYIHDSKKVNIYIGKIKSVKRYSAICELKDGTTITIYNEHLANAYLNDIVRVHVNNNSTGEVMDIISHALWEVVAVFKHHEFIVEERNFPYEIKVKKEKTNFHLVEGHVVLLKVKQYNGFTLHCVVSKVLGHKNDPGMDILTSIIKSGVKNEFDETLLQETQKVINRKEKSLFKDIINRKDFTDELIVTIDGLDAKDLDDAVSLKISDNGNYLLSVHIADVSHFVEENSMLDKEAFTRGTSIYLADRVIPMLPHSLSNGICSLNENEVRLTMSCIMEIDSDGEVIDYEITPSYIKSKARLDYDDVNRLFDNEPTRLTYSKEMKQMLFMMKRVSSILTNKMIKNGYIQLHVDEAKLNIDPTTNKVVSIEKRVSRTAEKLIENFMILANETVASHIFYMQLPFIYRIHESISKEKLAYMATCLKEMNVSINTKQNYLSAKQIQDVLDKVSNTPYEFVANNVVLRSMSKAIYSVNNVGHFGLGSECYTHFTSPIRRYPDLIVHRFLKKYLVENNMKDETEFLVQAADNSSVTERKAIALEREVEDIKKAEYMSSFVGCIYDGIITGVLDFGVFVQLDNTCEGLMRFETIPGAYDYNESYFKSQFKMGQTVTVKVLSTSVKNGEINFAYVSKRSYNNKGGKRHEKVNKHK